LRVFTARELTKAIAESAGLGHEFARTTLPEQVVVRRVGWPIDREAVQRTVMRSGLAGKFNFSQMRILLPADLTSARSSPQFEITAITPTPDHLRLFARVRCRERAACGSFLAEIVFSAPGTIAKRRGPRSEILASAVCFKQRIESATFSGPVLVRPGRLALFEIEGEGFRITQPVMPVKGARLGELVRVSDPKSHRSWLAQVAGSGQLRTPAVTAPKEAR
jgi:flagella basal body P-ring formation protein FlgA